MKSRTNPHPYGDPVPTPKDYQPPDEELLHSSVVKAFERHAAKTPEKQAILSKGAAYTYGELQQAVSRVAYGIYQRMGEEKGVVPLLFGKGLGIVAGMFGTLKSGNCMAPLDATFSKSWLSFILEDLGAKMLVTDSEYLGLAEELCGNKYEILNVDALPDQWEEVDPYVTIGPESLAFLLYTSGSTGKPKGLVRDHQNLASSLIRDTKLERCAPQDRIALLGSLSFGGSIIMPFLSLMNGASLHIYDLKEDGFARLVTWLKEEGITIYNSTPSMFRHFAFSFRDDDEFKNIRLVRLAGEAVLRRDFEVFKKHFPRQSRLRVTLVGTEYGGAAREYLSKDSKVERDVLPTGYPLDGVEIYIWDEQGREVAAGEVGEIVVRSTELAVGYWKRPELDRERFLPDPEGGTKRMCKTGDLGMFLPDGRLAHAGRKDAMVKIRGYRVEPEAVEGRLMEHRKVQEAAVTIYQPEGGEPRLVAHVVPWMTSERAPEFQDIVTEKMLRDYLADKVPEYMIPSTYLFHSSLPTTETGKLDRKALPEPQMERSSLPDAFTPPRDEIEAKLAKVWERILAIHPVGVDEEFLSLGGDSLRAMQLLAEIDTEFGIGVPLGVFYQAATIAKQAQLVRDGEWRAEWASLVALNAEGGRGPLFIVPGVRDRVLAFHALVSLLDKDHPVYALQSRGLVDEEEPLSMTEEIAGYFVEAIRTVQAAGPYQLCGYSSGGVIAFEMAGQLKEAGEEVGLLAILDTARPHSQVTQAVRRKRRLGGISRYGSKARGTLARLKRLAWQEIPRFMYRKSRAAIRQLFNWWSRPVRGTKRREADLSNMERKAWAVSLATRNAIRAYTARPYSGNVLVFWAEEGPYASVEDKTLGWGEVVSGKIEAVGTPGGHASMLRKPNVETIAQTLMRALEAAQEKA